MKILCVSGKARHGKDTIANLLKQEYEARNYRVLMFHYGDLVKYISTKFFNWDGNKDERGRSILQHVGTDAVRKKDENYWVNFLLDMLKFFPDEWDYIIVPDCRFPNEYEMCKNVGFDVKLLRIERSGFESELTEEQKLHPSEIALDNYEYDVFVSNSGSETDLKNKVPQIIALLDGDIV